MPFIVLTIALLVCAGLAGLASVRPKVYRKIGAGVVIAGGLLSGYAFGVLFTRTLLHQDWRVFLKDLLFFSLFYALLLEWKTRQPGNEPGAAQPAPLSAPAPAAQEPPVQRSYHDLPPEELRERLASLEVKHRQQSERLDFQKDWLAGIEAQYQDLMSRFQDAKSDDERGAILQTLGGVTEDMNRARLEVRNTEQTFQGTEREIKTVHATLERLEQSRQ
jgi:hypothetical protein